MKAALWMIWLGGFFIGLSIGFGFASHTVKVYACSDEQAEVPIVKQIKVINL